MPDPIDHLLALPPSEFISARNKLAAELKKADSARSAEIKALPKPSPSVWALNRVARDQPDRIAAFLDASDALEGAQSGRGGSYSDALAAQRAAQEEVVDAARKVLASAGLPDNRTVLERLTNNLRWGVVGDDTRQLLRAGRLLEDLEPPDFSALMNRIPVAGGAPPRRPTLKSVPAEKPGASASDRAEQKRQEALRARLAAGKEQIAAARDEVRRAKHAVEEAERVAANLRRETAAAEKKLADSERAHASAEQALARRQAEVDELTAELKAPRT